MRQALLWFAVMASFSLATGCGSRAYVAADNAKYPISMSSALRGPDGQILHSEDLQVVGQFKKDYMTCRMLWTLVPIKPLSGTQDISDDVNEQVARANGEAIINLAVESGATIWNVLTLVGVLPDCGKVKIRGDIVARKASPVPEEAAVPAPANPPSEPAADPPSNPSAQPSAASSEAPPTPASP